MRGSDANADSQPHAYGHIKLHGNVNPHEDTDTHIHDSESCHQDTHFHFGRVPSGNAHPYTSALKNACTSYGDQAA